MAQGRRALRLALEPLDELLVAGELFAQQLYRHVPVQNLVVSEVHLRHAATAQRPRQRVAIVDYDLLHATYSILYQSVTKEIGGARESPARASPLQCGKFHDTSQGVRAF